MPPDIISVQKANLDVVVKKKFWIFLYIMSWSYKHKPTKRHRTMQKFINRLLRKIFNIFWPVFSTEEMWRYLQEKPVAVQIKLWNWKWIRNTMRKDTSATDKQAFSCNPLPMTMQKGKTKD